MLVIYSSQRRYYEKKLIAINGSRVGRSGKRKSIRGAIAEIKNCTIDGAAMIDLHATTKQARWSKQTCVLRQLSLKI